MGERITRVILEAEIGRFEQNMNRAADATKRVKDEGDKLAETHQAMTTLGTAAFAMGAAVAAGVGVAVAKYAEFDQAMSFVAATGDDARQNMDALRQAALDAGAATVFSATESANAIEEMAKAGLSAQEILSGGLSGALDLAAAGGLEVADAAGIAATALKVFNLQGSDMSHVADLLAAGAGKAMGDVSDLSAALAQGGQVAAATGLSIEDTTASLAAFASQGLLGSDAGTSFKTMLQRLTPQSAEAQKKMDELGISAYDASGNFVGMAEFAGQLQEALRDLTPEQRNAALSVMFGSDAVRAANVIYAEGEEGIRDWIAAVDDQGYAADVAAHRLDNLIGDWEAFTGALDTAFITMGEGLDGPLRGLVQGLTGLVDGFNELPDGGKQAVLWIGLVTAGVGLMGGAALVAIPKIAELKLALITLAGTGTAARAGLSRFASFLGGPWGVALAAATTALLAYSKANEAGRASTEDLKNSLITGASSADLFKKATQGNSVDQFFWGSYEETLKNLPDLLDKAANSTAEWWDLSFNEQNSLNVIGDIGDALADIAREDMPKASDAFKQLVSDYNLTDSQAQELLRNMAPLRDVLLEQANAAGRSADDQSLLNDLMSAAEAPVQSAADAYLEQASAVEDLSSQLKGLIDQINKANGVAQDAVSANADWLEALDGVKAQAEELGTSLDQSTVAGSANAAALADVAASAQDAAAAQYEQDLATMSAEDATQKYIATLVSQRQRFIDAAVAAGYNADEVAALADEIFKVPTERETKVLVDTASAQSALDSWKARNSTLPVRVSMDGTSLRQGSITVTANAAGGIYEGGVKTFAGGGFEPGIYGYRPGGIHKFAEEYAEAYISMDPRRRARSEAVWNTVGDRLGFSAPAVVEGSGPKIEQTFVIQPGVSESQIARKSAAAINSALR